MKENVPTKAPFGVFEKNNYLFPILVVIFIGDNFLGSDTTEIILLKENIFLTEKNLQHNPTQHCNHH
jgi:hypothetical protein